MVIENLVQDHLILLRILMKSASDTSGTLQMNFHRAEMKHIVNTDTGLLKIRPGSAFRAFRNLARP